MSAKKWAVILVAFFIASVAVTLLLYRAYPTGGVGIYSDGELVQTISLNVDGEYEVKNLGINIITVRDGHVYVSDADCPDRVCVRHGALRKNDAIICVPNKVVVRAIRDNNDIDGVTGKSP